jgi:predicted small secreted protein
MKTIQRLLSGVVMSVFVLAACGNRAYVQKGPVC